MATPTRYAETTVDVKTTGTVPVAHAISIDCEGLTPVGAIFILTPTLTIGTIADGARFSIGVTDGFNAYCAAIYSEDGQVSTSTDTGYYLVGVLMTFLGPTSANPSVAGALDFVSFGVDTINVSYTNLFASAFKLQVIAVYGTNAACYAGDNTGSSTIGGTVTESIIGFDPGHIHIFSQFANPGSGGDARLGMGWITHHNGVIRQVAATYMDLDRHSALTSASWSLRDDCCIQKAGGAPVVGGVRLSATAVGASGFTLTTLNNDTNDATAEGLVYFFLAVKTGLQGVWCGVPALTTTSTSTTGNHTISDPGFEAHSAFCIGSKSTLLNTYGIGVGNFCYGFGKSGIEHVASYEYEYNSATGDSRAVLSAAFLRILDDAGGDDHVGSLVLSEPTGLKLNITTASASNRRVAILCLSDKDLIKATGAQAPTRAALSGSGIEKFPSSGALSRTATLTGSGAERFQASGALLRAATALQGTAAERFQASGALSRTAALAGSAAERFTAAGDLIVQSDLLGSAAHSFSASGSIVLDEAVLSAQALETFRATGDLPIDAAILLAQALERLTSAGAVTAPPALILGTAAERFVASGALARSATELLGTAFAAAAGVYTASGSITVAAALLSAQALEKFTSSGDLDQASVELAGIGMLPYVAAGQVLVGAADLDGLVLERFSASGSVDVDPAALLGSVLVLFACQGDLRVPVAVLSGSVLERFLATGQLTIPHVVLSGTDASEIFDLAVLAAGRRLLASLLAGRRALSSLDAGRRTAYDLEAGF